MPLFGFIMWVALKPFRRLTAMVSPRHVDPFGDAAGAFGGAARSTGRWARKAAATGVGVYTGNVAAAATVGALGDDDDEPRRVPDRAEAHAAADTGSGSTWSAPRVLEPAGIPRQRSTSEPRAGSSTPGPWVGQTLPAGHAAGNEPAAAYVVASEAAPLPPVEPEWVDGEEVYALYRPDASATTHAG